MPKSWPYYNIRIICRNNGNPDIRQHHIMNIIITVSVQIRYIAGFKYSLKIKGSLRRGDTQTYDICNINHIRVFSDSSSCDRSFFRMLQRGFRWQISARFCSIYSLKNQKVWNLSLKPISEVIQSFHIYSIEILNRVGMFTQPGNNVAFSASVVYGILCGIFFSIFLSLLTVISSV